MIKKSLLTFFGCLFGLTTAIALPPGDPGRPTSEPYAGDLAIFEDADREQRLQIERVMDLLGIKRGSHVADIGAGSGWFTVRSARRVGKEGAVFAVEINPAYVRHIKRRAKREKLSNIRTVLGKPDDPLLPRGKIDAVLLLKTYHEIAPDSAFAAHPRGNASRRETGNHRSQREGR